MTEREYLVGLTSFVAFGSTRIELLTSFFGSARKVWLASERKLNEVGLGISLTNKFIEHRKHFDFDKYFKRLAKRSIDYLTIKDKNYPANLKTIQNAPAVLYFQGKILPADANSVTVIGSRQMTSYGKVVTAKFVADLAAHGLTVISGLARGIDTQAHQVALSAGGRTIAVQGCGLDRVYPPENFKLALEIAKNGAVISEYPLGYPPLPGNFVNRNRILSGLGKAVLVIEGAKKSGTFLTVGHAADQGRTVFAVPGQITSPLSEAPLWLLQNGARLALSAQDIIDEIKRE